MFPVASGPFEIRGTLGLSLDQMHPVGEHILSARSDVPPGEWLVWVEQQCAMWIGGHGDALPAPVRRRLEHGDTGDVTTLLNELADAGVWLREAALFVEGMWTPSRRADIVLSEVATRGVFALSGIFVDSAGRAARLEITRGGICWTDHPTLVVQWLLKAVDLPAPQ
jgi:hypothetical protein